MGKFKEGQYVVATSGAKHIKKGDVVKIEKYARPTSYGEWLMIEGMRNNTNDGSYEESNFVAWVPKVGERVVEAEPRQYDLIRHWRDFWQGTEGSLTDDTFVVTKVTAGFVHYSNRVDGNGPQATLDCLAPLPVAAEAQPAAEAPAAPLNIEAGKFYRTRDGRKVGPAVHDTDHDYAGDGFVWRLGTLTYRNNGAVGWVEDPYDLIAEWQEPATNVGAQVDTLAEEYGSVVAERKLLKTHQGYGYELARFGNHVWVDVGKAAPVTMRADRIAA